MDKHAVQRSGPKRASLVTTAFPEVLKQLSIDEVRFLNRVFASKNAARDAIVSRREIRSIAEEINSAGGDNPMVRIVGIGVNPAHEIEEKGTPRIKNEKPEEIPTVHADNLKRLGLIERDDPPPAIPGDKSQIKFSFLS